MAKKTSSKKRTTKKESPKAKTKVKKVMHEYKHGELRSGKSKKKVTKRSQAVAIAMSEAGLSKKSKKK